MALLSLYSWSLLSRAFFNVGASGTEIYAVLVPLPQKVVKITGGLNISAWYGAAGRGKKGKPEMVQVFP